MTALIISQEHDMAEIVEIHPKTTQVIGSTIMLKENEKISVENLLNGLLINSGNDAAYALAYYNITKSSQPTIDYSKAIDQFVDKMNKKAIEFGMKNTNYHDPAGLNDDARSSVRDQGILFARFLRSQILSNIINKASSDISSVDGKIIHKLDNSNRLVKDEMFYDGIIGGKTGFTPTAGHNLITAAKRNDHTLIAVIINTYSNSKSASAIEARNLLDWGFTNLVWQKYF